jgi:uncharacterized protein
MNNDRAFIDGGFCNMLTRRPTRFVAVDRKKLERFVSKFYKSKDVMHDLTHVRRILTTAKEMSRTSKADMSILTFAAYFHRIDLRTNQAELTDYLLRVRQKREVMKRIFQAALESQKEAIPKTLEGKILHDAHLLEGGRTFGVVKLLNTGALRGESLLQVINHFDSSVGKYACCLPENKARFKDRESFARDFFSDLKKNLREQS